MRQKGPDQVVFREFLHNISRGVVTKDDFEFLKTRFSNCPTNIRETICLAPLIKSVTKQIGTF